MKEALAYFTKRVIAGLLVIIPIYLAILVLLKGMKSLGQLVRPFSKLLPDWLTAEQVLSLILVLLICSFIGAVLRTQLRQQVREWVERGVFEKIPGYGLFRSLTWQVAGDSQQKPTGRIIAVPLRSQIIKLHDGQKRSLTNEPITPSVRSGHSSHLRWPRWFTDPA